ncbi:MAG TPA: DEAD/DEAH box helicase family protein, partial [Firmicutes bacterium]|nr:DEAD/DEAH box helicase family protein [Bacillota bacterium]
MRLYLEELCENVSYEALGEWTVPNISRFSHNKTLFHYQIDAMKNAAKVLYHYFNAENGKQTFYAECTERGMPSGAFRVQKFARPIDRTRGLVDVRYSFLRNYFQPVETDNDGFIPGNSFFNRMAFWMATGSGKSLVIIKMIEYLYYLQARDLIPKKDIMLLLPREHLITQFKQEIQNYNLYADVPIELINLLDYEEDQRTPTLLNVFRVYYYRSDLVRDERKTVELDFRDYDNKGDWYIFLDEAHRGETGASKLQDYVSILSRNGFLFNFSATFVDAIDFATTGYNFNLERFIGAGYGKNIYLADSYFDFKKDRDDFNEREKQRQVLKSLMTLAMLKIARKECTYHTPLMMTLVNSVNTEDSDLLLFFEKIEEIAGGKMDNDLFEESKQELMRDFGNPEYVFGRERFGFRSEWLDDLRLEDILVSVFNTENHGKIEIIEGEKGKELVLKLETTDKPFALIKIGAADTFQKEKLGSNYSFVSGYESRNYFERINDNEDISILLGSRGFYEGWDSNRPNVINFINIGGRDAQRYVAQSIGRGVRIQPKGGRRQRLPLSDPDKNLLLETLFIFATDKSGVKAILNTIDEQKATNEYDLALSKTEERVFDLLIPVFGNSGDRADVAHFNIAEQSKSKFRQYFNCFDQNTLLIKTGLALDNYKLLNDKINDETLFQTDDRKVYGDMAMLLRRITEHVGIK